MFPSWMGYGCFLLAVVEVANGRFKYAWWNLGESPALVGQ